MTNTWNDDYRTITNVEWAKWALDWYMMTGTDLEATHTTPGPDLRYGQAFINHFNIPLDSPYHDQLYNTHNLSYAKSVILKYYLK